ncbi:MAG: hypothetical protein JNM25_01255 [Planctomycetes bacterium]|nr:hypothetical protein [Planctomycetota bacterium]
MHPHRSIASFCLLLVAACAAGPDDREGAGRGGGVVLQPGAQTFVGSGSFCTRPATIDETAVTRATPEWREMERDSVREGSARHSLLKTAMHQRVLAACRKAARQHGYDLVVRVGDIADSRGLAVEDLTAWVVGAL